MDCIWIYDTADARASFHSDLLEASQLNWEGTSSRNVFSFVSTLRKQKIVSKLNA